MIADVLCIFTLRNWMQNLWEKSELPNDLVDTEAFTEQVQDDDIENLIETEHNTWWKVKDLELLLSL